MFICFGAVLQRRCTPVSAIATVHGKEYYLLAAVFEAPLLEATPAAD
jgi:hypothetical protein